MVVGSSMKTLKSVIFVVVSWAMNNTVTWAFPVVEWNTIWGGCNSTSFWMSTESADGLGAGVMGLLTYDGNRASLTA